MTTNIDPAAPGSRTGNVAFKGGGGGGGVAKINQGERKGEGIEKELTGAAVLVGPPSSPAPSVEDDADVSSYPRGDMVSLFTILASPKSHIWERGGEGRGGRDREIERRVRAI